MSVVGTGKSAMVESANSAPIEFESRGRWLLCFAGVVLIGVGGMHGPGLLLFVWLRQLGGDCWWILASLVLLIGLHGTRLQLGGRLASAAFWLIWFAMRRHDLPQLTEATFARLGESPLGPMLVVLGGLVAATNLPGGRLRERWTAAADFVIRRRWMTLLVCGATLWVADPEHSHELCLNGAELCAEHGYYTPAIALTELARDTFPPPNFCGNCFVAEQEEMSARITLLKVREAGYRGDAPNATTPSGSQLPAVRAKQ